MAISDKTRKVLWAKSGNRCSLCRHALAMEIEEGVAPSIVGDECHIVSSKPNGPRHIELRDDQYDAVENLILLCKVHHKLVDDQVEIFTIDFLKQAKAKHELWVDQKLRHASKNGSGAPIRFLKRITNGTELAKLIGACQAYLLDNDPPKNETEADLIGYFHQDVFDWGEIWNGLQPSDRVRAGFSLNAHFAELTENSLQVYALIVRYVSKYPDGSSSNWPTLVLTVVHPNNPGITPLGELATIISDSPFAGV